MGDTRNKHERQAYLCAWEARSVGGGSEATHWAGWRARLLHEGLTKDQVLVHDTAHEYAIDARERQSTAPFSEVEAAVRFENGWWDAGRYFQRCREVGPDTALEELKKQLNPPTQTAKRECAACSNLSELGPLIQSQQTREDGSLADTFRRIVARMRFAEDQSLRNAESARLAGAERDAANQRLASLQDLQDRLEHLPPWGQLEDLIRVTTRERQHPNESLADVVRRLVAAADPEGGAS